MHSPNSHGRTAEHQPVDQALTSALDHLRQATTLAHSVVPSANTKKWLSDNVDTIEELIAGGAIPLLTIAALDGALNNPKHDRFGGSPVAWLAAKAGLTLKEANELKNARSLLYRPSSIALGDDASSLSAQQRAVVQKRKQAQLRRRLMQLGVQLRPIAIMARASDNLSEGCKHRRLDIIHAALDRAQQYSAAELKDLVDAAVVEANQSLHAKARTSRKPQLRFHDPDRFGYGTSTTYAAGDELANQQALLTDAQRAIAQLFAEAGIVDPLTSGQPMATTMWHTNNRLIRLGHQSLMRKLVRLNHRGELQVSAVRQHDLSSDNLGNADNADTADTAEATMVVYTPLAGVIGAGADAAGQCRTNFGTHPTIEQAFRMAPQGPSYLATTGKHGQPNRIHRIAADPQSGEYTISETVSSDTAVNQRFATRMQRLLLGLMQPYCAYPGCAVPAAKCQAHHVLAYQDGGVTAVDNLALICRFHHSKNDDSRSREGQGHFAKDEDGIAYWQPHGTPTPARQYNKRNGAPQLPQSSQSLASPKPSPNPSTSHTRRRHFASGTAKTDSDADDPPH